MAKRILPASASCPAVETDSDRKAYEAPELVMIDSARRLLQGNTYTARYRDCRSSGTTNYPSC
jgi:hypothetical protein